VHWSDCGPGRFSVMLRSLDRSNGLVVKPALPTIHTAEENDRSSAWSLLVRVQETFCCGRGAGGRSWTIAKGRSEYQGRPGGRVGMAIEARSWGA